MGEGDIFPIVDGMAALAVLLVMIRWGHLAVAVGTIGIPFVVEGEWCPGICTVAATAFAFVMGEWGGRLMAGRAIRIASMVEGENIPIFNVGMAADADAFVMLFGCNWHVTALAFGDVFLVDILMGVIEFGPLFDVGMAQDTLAWIVRFGQGG